MKNLFLSAAAALLCQSLVVGARTLTFDDLALPNEPDCSTLDLSTNPYHGFLITGTVFNTTQTQSCHEHSSGAGPWHKAQSQPSILYNHGTIVFTPTNPKKSFSISKLTFVTNVHWSIIAQHPGLKIAVKYVGKDKKGAVVKKRTLVYGPDATQTLNGPKPVQLQGFNGLAKFEASAELRYKGDDGKPVKGVGDAYIDDVVYN